MIGIVIVTWNSADVVGSCLQACLRFPGVEIVVVDNASTDDTISEVRKFPAVRLAANTVNQGFAGGVNQGMAMLESPVVLVLNPDAVPVRGLDRLAAAAAAESVGAAGGALVDSAGAQQHGFNVRGFPGVWTLAFEVLGVNRLAPWNPVNRRYRRSRRGTGIQEVDQPAGAFLMVNRAAWEAVDGFDERFHPAWFEDVDFCLRLKKSGYRILFVPDAVARHIGGHSASRLGWGNRQVFWYGNLLRFAALHFAPWGRRMVAASVILGFLPRAAVRLAANRDFDAAPVCVKVFRLACRCWRDGVRFSGFRTSGLSRKGEEGPAVLS